MRTKKKKGPTTQLSYITFTVWDVKKTVEFYEKVTSPCVVGQLNPRMGEITFMAGEDGGTILEFAQSEDAEEVSVREIVINFLVKGDPEEQRKRIAALGYRPSDIVVKGPKLEYFTAADPDGIIVEFSAQIDITQNVEDNVASASVLLLIDEFTLGY